MSPLQSCLPLFHCSCLLHFTSLDVSFSSALVSPEWPSIKARACPLATLLPPLTKPLTQTSSNSLSDTLLPHLATKSTASMSWSSNCHCRLGLFDAFFIGIELLLTLHLKDERQPPSGLEGQPPPGLRTAGLTGLRTDALRGLTKAALRGSKDDLPSGARKTDCPAGPER
jgi:hypothetical protein